jgi:hypothetical protein
MFAQKVIRRDQFVRPINLMRALHFAQNFYVVVRLDLLGKVRNGEDLDNAMSNINPFFRSLLRGLSGKCTTSLDYKTWLQAHRYVLFNYDKIEPYLK